MSIISDQRRAEFQEKVWQHHAAHGRMFPWRETSDPYEILVSEVMLQQTQAERVVLKYVKFLETFPNVRTLAAASQSDVIKLWSGLGYNRRALALKRCAEEVVNKHGGVLPRELGALQDLPGIGPYTASAVLAFAFNQPVVVVETNIRSVYLHEFFPGEEGIHDSALAPYVAETIATESPAAWYQALMDYGAHLKKQGINPSRRSRHHQVQAPLKGSLREARGAILKAATDGPVTTAEIGARFGIERQRVVRALKALVEEGFVTHHGDIVELA